MNKSILPVRLDGFAASHVRPGGLVRQLYATAPNGVAEDGDRVPCADRKGSVDPGSLVTSRTWKGCGCGSEGGAGVVQMARGGSECP